MTQHFFSYLSITPLSLTYISNWINMYSKEMDLQLILQALALWFWVTTCCYWVPHSRQPGGELVFRSLALSRHASHFSPYWPMVGFISVVLSHYYLSHAHSVCNHSSLSILCLPWVAFPHNVSLHSQHIDVWRFLSVWCHFFVIFSLFAFSSLPLHIRVPNRLHCYLLIDIPCCPHYCSSLYIHWPSILIIFPFS